MKKESQAWLYIWKSKLSLQSPMTAHGKFLTWTTVKIFSVEKAIEIGSQELISIQLDLISLQGREIKASRFGTSSIHAAPQHSLSIQLLFGQQSSMTQAILCSVDLWMLQWSFLIWMLKRCDRRTEGTQTLLIALAFSHGLTSLFQQVLIKLWVFGTWEQA